VRDESGCSAKRRQSVGVCTILGPASATAVLPLADEAEEVRGALMMQVMVDKKKDTYG
jgi:hypothetical protein